MLGNSLSFGSFELFPDQKKLLKDGEPVSIGSRAFEILILLVSQAGQLVGNREIMDCVWPNTIVEEANLRVNMTVLRRALGELRGEENYIKNTPGRGYTFVAPLDRRDTSPGRSTEDRPRLPMPVTRVIGRATVVATVRSKLGERRLLTIVGPGGIGKTSVALIVANEVADDYPGGAVFIDLAPLSGAGLVASALASACGIPVVSTDPTPALVKFFRDKKCLVVFDNCEHVVEEAASLIEILLMGASNLCVLTTSREPLRSQGEWIYQLEPLSIPDQDAGSMSFDEAVCFSAMELFLERAKANLDGFSVGPDDVPKLVQLCKKLDGIPLAIELAAARINHYGLSGLLAHIGNQLELLTRGRRTGLPHHKTLRATLDWSYNVLPDLEKSVLQRLSVFKGRFTATAASIVVAADAVTEAAAADAISSLTEKSLVSVDTRGPTPRYRLLETTRAYAADRFKANGAQRDLYLRHAKYLCRQMEWIESDCPLSQRRQAYLDVVDDIRSALEWAFSPDGDVTVGIALTKLSSALWFHLSFVHENRQRLETALAALSKLASPDPLDEIALNVGYGHALWHTAGHAERMVLPFRRALTVAEQTGDTSKLFLPLWGIWAFETQTGRYLESRRVAERFGELAMQGGDLDAVRIHERILGLSLHYSGAHSLAEQYATRVLTYGPQLNPLAPSSEFQFDRKVAALTIIARVQWIRGLPDTAAETAQQCIDEAKNAGHALSLCYALSQVGCLVPAWRGETDVSRKHADLLCSLSNERSLSYWLWWAECYQACLSEPFAASETSIVERMPDARFTPLHFEVLATLRPAFVEESTYLRACEGDAGWCAPEAMRVRGEFLLKRASVGEAETLFLKAIELARGQEALSWQLRAATSLARLWTNKGRRNDALVLLGDVYRQFSEGFATTDLQTAAALLESLKAS